MIRKLKRSIARHNMWLMDIDIFGKYAPKDVVVRDKRSNKFVTRNLNRSFFSRTWRAYLK